LGGQIERLWRENRGEVGGEGAGLWGGGVPFPTGRGLGRGCDYDATAAMLVSVIGISDIRITTDNKLSG
jgi:hypothetical protein